jgi:hypothetical protein
MSSDDRASAVLSRITRVVLPQLSIRGQTADSKDHKPRIRANEYALQHSGSLALHERSRPKKLVNMDATWRQHQIARVMPLQVVDQFSGT